MLPSQLHDAVRENYTNPLQSNNGMSGTMTSEGSQKSPSSTSAGHGCFTLHVWTAPCWQEFSETMMQSGRVLSCVRPVDAVLLTAGPNAIRRIGSQSKLRAQSTWGEAGFPDPRFDRLCIMSLSLRQTRKLLMLRSGPKLREPALAFDMFRHAGARPRQYGRFCWPAPALRPWLACGL